MKVFIEKQKFSQTWLWVLMAFSGVMPIAILGVGLYVQIGLGKPFGNNPMSDGGLITVFLLTLALMVGMLLLFAFSTLELRIDKRDLHIRFIPFIVKEKVIPWTSVENWEVVKYNPIREYGGWGLRYGKSGKAYNVKGDKGLRLSFHKGKPLLIGTSKPDELQRFLEELDPLKRQSSAE